MNDMIGIAEIAARLNVENTTVRRLIAREADNLKIDIHRGKGDRVLLNKDHAEILIQSYLARRGPQSANSDDSQKFDKYGYFYVIQLIPELLPDRVKIGFADNVDRRLEEHRTAAPTAKVVKFWSCKRSWDYAAMDSLTREGCKLVLNEVYEGNVEGFIKRGDEFFNVMPNPDNEKLLSHHSPMYSSEEEK